MAKIWNHAVRKDSQTTRKECKGSQKPSKKFWPKRTRGQKPWLTHAMRSSQRIWNRRSLTVLLRRSNSSKLNKIGTLRRSSSWVSSINSTGLQQEQFYNHVTGISARQLSRFLRARMYPSRLCVKKMKSQLKPNSSIRTWKAWRSLPTWSIGAILVTANTTICTVIKNATSPLPTLHFHSQSSNFSCRTTLWSISR